MAIPFAYPFTVRLTISNPTIIGQQLTNFSCETAVLVIYKVVIGSCTIELPTPSKPPSPACARFVEIGPCFLVAVQTESICQMMWSSTVWSARVSLKDIHSWAVGNIWIVMLVVFKSDIRNKSLKIEWFPCTNNVMHSRFLNKREFFSSYGHRKHSNCISSFAVFYGTVWVAGWAGWPRISHKVGIPQNTCVIVCLVCVPQSDSSSIICKEHLLVYYPNVRPWIICH